ncbi:hypothetical protein K501DRAFT_192961 [Backusella circina FSU 941]|nr:hypothetical protein K501DRAFT_192961 [Backusella circina FSU 941]
MNKNALALTGQPFSIDSYNIHRLVISGVMVASKFFSDVFYTNTRYAKVGGLPVSELNSLEIEFLKLNSFNLTVPICELQRYGDQLLKVGYIQEMRKPFRHCRSNSFDQPRHDADGLIDLTQRISLDDPYYSPSKRSSSGHLRQPRRMTSTQSLKETRHEPPRHTRSSVNLYQGFWKPSSPVQTDKSPSHRLSLSSIHAPPFIPSENGAYYHPVGIPTPPPSASPVHRHSYL